MDLVGVIMNAGQGLGVFRAQVATASHNIANANTPGYARQDAVVTETTPAEEIGTNGYIGRGVSLQGVVQNRDQFIETQLSTAYGNSSSSSAQSDALSTVTALDTQQQGGITDAVGKFYSALRDLNQNPGDTGLRQTVVDSAQSLAKAFNVTATSLTSCRSGIDQNVGALLDKANGLLTSVADLNRKIALAVNSGRTPNDLLDVRQNDLDQLAQMLGTKAVPDDHSNVSVLLPDGTALVSGTVAAKLSTQANSGNSGHLDVVFTPLDGSQPAVLKASDMSGQIGGLLNARDEVLGTSQSNLDTLAYDFATTVNTQHELGYGLDGSTGNDLFASLPDSTDAATNIAVDPTTYADPSLIAAAGNPSTSATGGPGDSDNLQAIIDTESTKLSTGLDVQDGMAKLTSDFGIAVSSASDSSEFDKNLLTDLTNARESASGVSVDDELTKLMQAQTSYNALTKVVTTTNSLLDTLMKMF
jgi:flagellar hook-associated protein 1 FlgK